MNTSFSKMEVGCQPKRVLIPLRPSSSNNPKRFSTLISLLPQSRRYQRTKKDLLNNHEVERRVSEEASPHTTTLFGVGAREGYL